MVNAASILEHMPVISSCGHHVGLVDRVEGDSIKLTRNDPEAGGRHHEIPLEWVKSVDDRVHLKKPWNEVRWEWYTVSQAAGG